MRRHLVLMMKDEKFGAQALDADLEAYMKQRDQPNNS